MTSDDISMESKDTTLFVDKIENDIKTGVVKAEAILARCAKLNETDAGNAERFVLRHGADFRHLTDRKKWLVWDGQRWDEGADSALHEAAKRTARAIFGEAMEMEKGKKRDGRIHWARISENRRGLHDMLDLAAKSLGIAVTVDQFDRDPFLLNVQNGTLDLRTGMLRPHRREDLLTKLAPVKCDPAAQCPVFMGFIERILPDPEVRDFVQRYLGSALTGDIRDQCLLFAYGTGANGKSTLVNVIMHILAGYAQPAPRNLLTAKRFDNDMGADIVDLKGARFVAVSEFENGKRLDEALVKSLTGGEPLRGRKPYEDYVTFTPTHKLFLSANNEPKILNQDDGIWRRIKKVPFTVSIPKEEQDARLLEKLKREASGILNWLIAGCRAWQKNGLGEPEAVRQATAEYRAGMDPVAAFLQECCFLGPNAQANSQKLHAAYTAWAAKSDEIALSAKAFRQNMARLLHREPKRKTAGMIWEGVSLVMSDQEPADSGSNGLDPSEAAWRSPVANGGGMEPPGRWVSVAPKAPGSGGLPRPEASSCS